MFAYLKLLFSTELYCVQSIRPVATRHCRPYLFAGVYPWAQATGASTSDAHFVLWDFELPLSNFTRYLRKNLCYLIIEVFCSSRWKLPASLIKDC